jgi:hypothetical protein
MAVRKAGGDAFVNVAYLSLVLSAANTLTFKKLDVITGALLGAKQYAMLIERVEFHATIGTMQEFTADGDHLTIAITVADGLTGIGADKPEVIAQWSLNRHDFGTAASAQFIEKPAIRDFTNLTGGGLLVPADRVFLASMSLGLASAASVAARLYYTVVEMGGQEYLELLQMRRMITT